MKLKIGKLIKNMPELHGIDYPMGFNFHENAFFRKFIPKELIEQKLRVKPESFFKAFLILSYFTGVIDSNYKSCENLVEVYDSLKADAKRKKGGTELTTPEKEKLYFSLEAVVTAIGLELKARADDFLESDQIERRYNALSKKLEPDGLRETEPFYNALGVLISDVLSEPMRPYLEGVCSRQDIGALVTTDAILEVYGDDKLRGEVKEHLDNQGYLKASLIALKALKPQVSRSKMEGYLKNG